MAVKSCRKKHEKLIREAPSPLKDKLAARVVATNGRETGASPWGSWLASRNSKPAAFELLVCRSSHLVHLLAYSQPGRQLAASQTRGRGEAPDCRTRPATAALLVFH